jgi:hypothetical protein
LLNAIATAALACHLRSGVKSQNIPRWHLI